jgi:hypothetical protein
MSTFLSRLSFFFLSLMPMGKKKALPQAEQRVLFEETTKEQAPPNE